MEPRARPPVAPHTTQRQPATAHDTAAGQQHRQDHVDTKNSVDSNRRSDRLSFEFSFDFVAQCRYGFREAEDASRLRWLEHMPWSSNETADELLRWS